jgi:predicted cupin superfamily sugar epimerase
MNRKEKLIQQLELIPHPEGGYYKETYRSEGSISKSTLPADYSGDRSYSTGIYFMLIADTFSAFHKINQDEMWHFYDGSSIELHMITSDGIHSCVHIGRDIENGEYLQYVVPGGVWFASRVKGNAEYSLLGCTVSPGFDFADFILPNTTEMTALFPRHAEIIGELTRE